MKRFIIRVLLFATILFVPIVATYFCMFKYIEYVEHNRPTNVSLSLEVNVSRSLEKIKKCDSNKIILIAGSNAGYGFSSNLLSNNFGVPIFNTGTNAGLGLRFQIELFKDYLKAGDVVVLLPEYEQFCGSFLGETALVRIIAYHKNYRGKISINQMIHSVNYIYPAIKELSFPADSVGVAGFCSLNEFGDIFAIREHKPISPYFIKGDVDYKCIAYLKDFIEKCPATVILLPPVFQDKSFDANIDKINLIDSILCENGIGYDAKPSRYRFDDSLMYDTPYHCTLEGAMIRTNLVIEDMKRILGR